MQAMTRALCWLMIFSLGFGTLPAHAWSAVGHRMTGRVAVLLLTAKTKSRLQQIVGTDDLVLLSTYMDERRRQLSQSLPGSDQWHYNNRPICDSEESLAAHCPNGNCASNKIEEFAKVLGDESAPIAERANAVRFLVHIIGDIHQPLHSGDNHDRGGNDIKVKLSASAPIIDLHGAWDGDFINEMSLDLSEVKWAAQLKQTYAAQIVEARKGSVSDWMQQSYELAKADAYALPSFACGEKLSDVIVLEPAYIQHAKEVIPLQLARAGARIAYVLNQALDPKPKSAK